MINKDSIVTAYNEHLTLVEWLQKVEKALNTSVLTNLSIAKLSDQNNVATYQVTATFADNTTIVSDTFTLPSTDIVTAFSNLRTLVNGFDTRITANTNNIAKALFMPSSAPSTRKVVTIDTNGAQDNVDPTELPTLMANIIDSHGNKRFVESNFNGDSKFFSQGKELEFAKCELAGNHLMLVLVIHFNSASSYSGAVLGSFDIPSYIGNKIIPYGVVDGFNIVSTRVGEKYDVNQDTTNFFSNSEPYTLYKQSNTKLGIVHWANETYTSGSYLRLQFDLVIDNE